MDTVEPGTGVSRETTVVIGIRFVSVMADVAGRGIIAVAIMEAYAVGKISGGCSDPPVSGRQNTIVHELVGTQLLMAVLAIGSRYDYATRCLAGSGLGCRNACLTALAGSHFLQ